MLATERLFPAGDPAVGFCPIDSKSLAALLGCKCAGCASGGSSCSMRTLKGWGSQVHRSCSTSPCVLGGVL